MSGAQVYETHISNVFMVGDRAFKLKKPVKLEFIDLSTRELRQRCCEREVELNRRIAPDVYLGVADIVGPDGAVWTDNVGDAEVDVRRDSAVQFDLALAASLSEIGRAHV